MIRVLSDVLSTSELQAVRGLLAQVAFADGRITNRESTVKRNLQAPHQDEANAHIAQVVREALFRHQEFRVFAQPRSMARATAARYEPGMTYGWHVDEALFPSTPPMRSDLSCTIFLNPPEEYDGGQLVMQLGQQELSYKLAPGSALVYPSTTIHQVAPVTRGVREVAITWVQSWLADAQQRELMIQLEEAKARVGTRDARTLLLLESLRTNLFRMWADT